LRHAKASTITITYGIDDGEFFISLSDDGIGGAQVSADGNGLKNMRQRAAALNAQLNVESTEKGTTIRLQFRPRPAATPVSL
jgi:signal transduction histidine kinase